MRSVGNTQAAVRYIVVPACRKGWQLMELEQIEALTDLRTLSRVDLYNLLGRAEQLRRRLTAESKRRRTENESVARNTADHGAVEVAKPGLTGTWPIMHFKNGQRVSISWFVGTLKDAFIERNRLMAKGGDFRVGVRKEDIWKSKQDHWRHPGATSGERSRILQG
jgi:hypothetical protein